MAEIITLQCLKRRLQTTHRWRLVRFIFETSS